MTRAIASPGAFSPRRSKGDLAGLRSLLADAVMLTADGGGKSTAWRRPIGGLDHVVGLFEGLHRKPTRKPPILIEIRERRLATAAPCDEEC